MKTKIGLPFGLALVMFIGIFTVLLALGALNPHPAEAVTGSFTVTQSNSNAGEVSSYGFSVVSAADFEAGDTLTITFPTGTVLPSGSVGNTANWTLGPGVPASVSVNPFNRTVALEAPAGFATIALGGAIAVAASEDAGIVNPPAGTGLTLSVVTSDDAVSGASNGYDIAIVTSISDFELTSMDEETVSGFSFTFVSDAAFNANDILTLTFPEGTGLSDNALGDPTNWTLGSGVPASVIVNPTNRTVGLQASSTFSTIAAGADIAVAALEDAGIVNPPAGTGLTLSVVTTGDTDGFSVTFDIEEPSVVTPTPTTGLTLESVTADPRSPGAIAQYVIAFRTGEFGKLTANSGTITVHFDKDFGGLGPLSKEDVVVASSTGGAVNPAVDPVRTLIGSPAAYVNNVEYTITVPDMNGDDPSVLNIEGDAFVTVTISPGAGISNPTEAGNKGPIGVYTSAEPVFIDTGKIPVPRQLFLTDYDNNRNKETTVLGYGFKDKTTATIWLEKTDVTGNEIGRQDPGEVVLITADVLSNDTFEKKFTVRVPPFVPGKGNIISARDGQDNTAVPVIFEVQGLMTVTSRDVSVGDTLQISVVDWSDGSIPSEDEYTLIGGNADADDALKQGTLVIGGIRHTSRVNFTNGSANFSVVIDNNVPLGSQRMDLKVAGEADDLVLNVKGANLSVTPTTVVANQTISVTGSEFSGANATINGTLQEEDNASEGESPSYVSFGGDPAGLKASDGGQSDKINGGAVINIDNGGSWSASIVVPITDAATTPGIHQLKVIDSLGREGVTEVTIAERMMTLEPAVGRPGTTVHVTGTGYPASNSRVGADAVTLVQIYYGDFVSPVASVSPDSSGNFSTSFRVPLTADIPSDSTVTSEFDHESLSNKVTDTAIHTIPGATISLSSSEGSAGDTVTVSGEGFKAYTSVKRLEIGDLELDVSANTGAAGSFEASFLVPELDSGIQNVEVEVGNTVASASFRVLIPGEGDTMMPGMMPNEAMAPAMAFAPVIAEDNLITVYHFDPATQSEAPNRGWTLYDARPLFMGGNNLDMINPGGFYFLQVKENQMGVEIGGRTMDLYAGLNPVQW